MPAANVADFVGDQACADCHASEFRSHAATRHAATLRRVDRRGLGSLAPKTGRMGKTGYVLLSDGEHFAISAEEHRENVADLHLALGSGKTGMTFVTLLGSRLAEAEMSYFPRTRQWYRTPGHEDKPKSILGQMYGGEFPRRCIGCHSVTMPSYTLMPEDKFFGVGCEACHGPGSAHVDAAAKGSPSESPMLRLGSLEPAKLNNLCGKCHLPFQTAEGSAMGAGSNDTHRFQPLGIMKSACFTKGGGSLSCLTCHDPHTDASTDERKYEAVCLSCHNSKGMRNGAVPTAIVPGKVCPVNPNTKCIGCHMPPRRAFKDSTVPTNFTEHYIRIYRPKLSTQR